MEIDDLLDIGMEIGLLFNTLVNLLEERLVDELLDATNGEMRHKVLSVAEIAKTVEGVKDILFQVVQCFGFVFHAKPKHARRVITSEDACTVEVHGKRLVVFGLFLAGFDDLGNVLVGGVAHKLQSEMDLVGLAPVDVATFVFEVVLEMLHQGWIFFPDRDGDG